MNLSHGEAKAWHRELIGRGFPAAEARAWIAVRIHDGDREAAAAWADMDRGTFDTQLELAKGRFDDAVATHLLMFGPSDRIAEPEGELREEMEAAFDLDRGQSPEAGD